MSEFLSAIRKGCDPSLYDPGREPAFCGLKALESLNCFQSAVQLFVATFDEIGGLWTAIVKEIFRTDIAREQIAVVENMLERCDLERIIVVTRCSPANMPFEIVLPQTGKGEDLLFQIFDETPVRFLASHLQGLSNVLQKMDMAELDDDTRIDSNCCHANGFVVVADQCLQVIAGVLQLREVLEHRLIVLGRGKQADRNIVRQVIDAVDERNLSIIAFHCHELPVDNQEAAETFGIAVGEGDLVVVWKGIQLFCETPVGCIDAFADLGGKCTDACSLQMLQEQCIVRRAVIDTETCATILAAISLQPSPRTIPFCVQALARFTGKTAASCSVFFGVNMFELGKMAS